MTATHQDPSGWVFNIQHYSVHDGPGIRTTVFLKGCPLRCLWCGNPESQQLKPQILFENANCIRCDTCTETCPEDAIIVNEDGIRQVNDQICTLCGVCIDECYAEGLELIGKEMTVDAVMAEIKTDQTFYDKSGGGVTLSGGDPTMQHQFSLEILKRCKALGIHTALETSGHTSWKIWESFLPYLDLVLYDVKELNADLHKAWTGVSNDLILDNLQRLANTDVSVIVRRPVIPGYNDSIDSIHALGRFVRNLGGINEVNILPYHRFGKGKYERLGLEYAMGDTPSMTNDDVAEQAEILRSYGLKVKVGG